MRTQSPTGCWQVILGVASPKTLRQEAAPRQGSLRESPAQGRVAASNHDHPQTMSFGDKEDCGTALTCDVHGKQVRPAVLRLEQVDDLDRFASAEHNM